MDKGSLL